jgi:phosphate transport system substrate-binding protein
MRSHHNFITATLSLIVSIGLSLSTGSAEEKIVLDGSTGMLPLATALAKAYQQKYPDAQLELGKGLGTGARLRALAEGKIQIALASHGIKPEDLEKANAKVIEVAKGAIVFAVNSSVPVTELTETRLCDIYGGKVKSWQAMGGPDESIAVLTRPSGEVDPEVIREKIGCFKDLKILETAKVMAKGGDMANGLAQIPYAIGMTSMTVVEQSGGKVKPLKLNGVVPTAENVKSGGYFLSRDFYFVIKEETTLAIKKFLEFVVSPEGERVILANGAIPSR